MGSPIASSKKLLVNADDFGLSPAINAGIVAAHLNGIVRSTSIVASGDAFAEAVLLSKSLSLGVGVHLTLVEEAAVARGSEIPTLAPQGMLPMTYGALIKGVATGRIYMRDIEREFRAQIEKSLAAGLQLTHLDSHQHTHAFPNIFKLVVRLGIEYQIPGIRIPRANLSWEHRHADRFLPKCVLCLLAHGDALFCLNGAHTAEHFAGLFESGDLNEAALLGILAALKGGTTELVCHPGQPDSSLKYAKWSQRRVVELAALTSPGVKQMIDQVGIELIDYRQLCEGSASTADSAV